MTIRTLFAAILAATPGAAAQAQEAAAGGDAAFADAVAACTVATHEGPHPFVRGFTIEHAISGESDGTCGYSQTMPGGMRMECRLSADGRDALADEFRAMAEGRMAGSTGSPPAWNKECEIVDKDGKRTPLGRQ